MNPTSKTSLVAALMISTIVASKTECAFAGVPVVDSALGCVETTIATVHAPTGDSMADGGVMTFHKDIAPGHGAKNHPILGVYVPPNYYVTGSVGDRVRVCLISVPRKTESCNPATDDRGRQFLIYDRPLAYAMLFADGEHDCGGA